MVQLLRNLRLYSDRFKIVEINGCEPTIINCKYKLWLKISFNPCKKDVFRFSRGMMTLQEETEVRECLSNRNDEDDKGLIIMVNRIVIEFLIEFRPDNQRASLVTCSVVNKG
jgi:hypothetical protein